MSPTGDLVQALEACLERMQADGEDADAALSSCAPVETADELRPLVELGAQLRALDPLPGPDPAFRRALAAQLAAAPEPRAIRDRRAAESGRGLLARLWRSTAFTAAAAATVILFLSFGAAYASADALPGEALYPLKRTLETARLLFATDAEAAVALHLENAGRRLEEAVAQPGHGGVMLADFSREVTAALVEADGAMAAGVARDEIAPPLLAWLVGARVELVAAEAVLPPMAWRAALALVDEAIAALQTGGPLARRPTLLPEEVEGGLRARPGRGDELPWAAGILADPPWSRRALAARPGAPSGGGGELTVRVAESSDTGVEPVDLVPDPGIEPISAGAAGEPRGSGPAGGLPVEPSPRPVDPTPRPGGGNDKPTDAPTRAPPPSQPAPSETPPPTATPSPRPSLPPPTPTEAPATAEPATPSAEPSPSTEPIAPTSTPVVVPPTVTPTPQKRPPTFGDISCNPAEVKVYDKTDCTVAVADPDQSITGYAWSTYYGRFENGDRQEAIYYAETGPPVGASRVKVPIEVEITYGEGQSATVSGFVTVLPRFQQLTGDGREAGR
jgi:hypothetical protein